MSDVTNSFELVNNLMLTYPRIIANDSSLEKYAAPGSTVTVSFPVQSRVDMFDYYYKMFINY